MSAILVRCFEEAAIDVCRVMLVMLEVAGFKRRDEMPSPEFCRAQIFSDFDLTSSSLNHPQHHHMSPSQTTKRCSHMMVLIVIIRNKTTQLLASSSGTGIHKVFSGRAALPTAFCGKEPAVGWRVRLAPGRVR